MSATTAAMNPVAQPAPARPAAGPPPSADDSRFDRHLDAARQQHGGAQDKPAQEEAGHETAAETAPAAAAAAVRKPADAPAKEDIDPNAAALAAAMLALIGQAAPAKPIALASALTHAAAKAITGAQAAAHAPAALAVLTGGGAAAPLVQPVAGLDAGALAPVLAKPAEQKDAPPDAAQLASLSSASLTTSAPATAAAPTPTHNLNIASPAGTPAFAQELGEHVVWLGQQDVKQARIRLHPEDLGSMDVKVSINHDRIDVSFAVQHPAAVHAVQQTLPQLDALLAQHGLALGQADVGQRQQHGESGRGREAPGATSEIDAGAEAIARTPVAALGMLDTFA